MQWIFRRPELTTQSCPLRGALLENDNKKASAEKRQAAVKSVVIGAVRWRPLGQRTFRGNFSWHLTSAVAT